LFKPLEVKTILKMTGLGKSAFLVLLLTAYVSSCSPGEKSAPSAPGGLRCDQEYFDACRAYIEWWDVPWRRRPYEFDRVRGECRQNTLRCAAQTAAERWKRLWIHDATKKVCDTLANPKKHNIYHLTMICHYALFCIYIVYDVNLDWNSLV